MKSLLLPLLAFAAPASAGEVMIGAAGGVVAMDPLETLDTTWTVNGRFDYFFDENLAIELESGFLQGRTRIGDHPYMGLTPRLNLVGRLWNKGPKNDVDGSYGKPPFIRPLLVAGIGGFYKNTDDRVLDENGAPVTAANGDYVYALGDEYTRNDIDFTVNAGPGFLIPLGNTLAIRSDLRWIVNLGTEGYRLRGDRFVDWEWTAGLTLRFGGPRDKDKDGILDADDLCPDQPEDMDGFEDANGCPDDDNDGDGISDADEGTDADGNTCANAAEDMDGFEDTDGCPDPDNDGDGVLDAADTCPTEAGSKTADGCPDEDGDGVVDAEDECIDEAGDASAAGCPDDDSDRVPNYRDECPTEAAPAGIDPLRSNGCPTKVFITADAIKILDKVFFDVGKATIKSKSNELLDQIAETLIGHPEIKKVQIEGHTDNTGDAEKNKVLSNDRAKAVVDHLVAKGVEADRLTSVGFGQEKPLADGEAANTEEGRAQNRRVEFNITEQDELTTEFVRERLTTEEATVELEGDLKVTKAVVPMMESVKGTPACDAMVHVNAEGTVQSVAVTGCVALPRSTTRRALQQWTFEPMKNAEGTAVPFTVEVKMNYVMGRGVPAVDPTSVQAAE